MTPDNQRRIKRLRTLLFRAGWRAPFWLAPGARVTFRIDPSVETACVNRHGVIRFGPAYLDGLTDEEAMFVILHEVGHPLLRHFDRIGSRTMAKANRASDRPLNQFVRASGFKAPAGVLWPRAGEESWTFEQTYDTEPDLDDEGGEGGEGDDMSEGEKPEGEGTEGEDPGDPGKSPSDQEWREIAEVAKELARASGKGEGVAAFLADPPSRVRWRDVLRGACARAVAAHGYDDVSFRRLSRRSDEFLLPGPIAYRALVAVALDTSGSVPDAALEIALGEIVAISKLQPDVRFFLVTHDAAVQWSGWIQAGQKGTATIRAAMAGRGGTRFAPAYEAIEGTKKRFDAMVHLTDGVPCETWPAKPRNVRRPVVALIGHAERGAIPEGWRVVETEVPR